MMCHLIALPLVRGILCPATRTSPITKQTATKPVTSSMKSANPVISLTRLVAFFCLLQSVSGTVLAPIILLSYYRIVLRAVMFNVVMSMVNVWVLFVWRCDFQKLFSALLTFLLKDILILEL